jgi:hypothetical protein
MAGKLAPACGNLRSGRNIKEFDGDFLLQEKRRSVVTPSELSEKKNIYPKLQLVLHAIKRG